MWSSRAVFRGFFGVTFAAVALWGLLIFAGPRQPQINRPHRMIFFKHLGTGIHIYAHEHDGRFPHEFRRMEDVERALTTYRPDLDVLLDREHEGFAEFYPNELLAEVKTEEVVDPGNTVMVWTDPIFHNETRYLVAVDSSAMPITEEKFREMKMKPGSVEAKDD